MKLRVLIFQLTLVIVQGLIICGPNRALAAEACSKRFKNVLVLAGGGITPGIALGMLAGARAAGKKPDAVISTCGSSVSTAVANAFDNPKDAYAFIKSRRFHDFLMKNVKVREGLPISIGMEIMNDGVEESRIPDVFDNYVMEIPTKLPPLFKETKFKSGDTRYIMVGARALFNEKHVGMRARQKRLYQQTFFTDPDTAKSLQDLPASIKKNFPNSPIYPWTQVRTDVSTLQAARAGIADPFLMNPSKINGEYYFAGAIDLYPIETAKAIGCEVTVSGPPGDFGKLPDLAVRRGFGYSPLEREQQLKKYKNVRWINKKGANELSMDPGVSGVTLENKIPTDYNDFVKLIERQYEFGYERAYAAYSDTGANQRTSSRRASPSIR
jgi:hypothetical protein